jgi:hypothetical protein
MLVIRTDDIQINERRAILADWTKAAFAESEGAIYFPRALSGAGTRT